MASARLTACLAVWAATLAGVVAALAGASHGAAAAPAPPQDFSAVRAAYLSSDLNLLDRRGIQIQTLRRDNARRRLDWIALEDVSPALLRILIGAEDKRFWEHGGVDWQAVAGAAWQNLWGNRPRGASTLSMQLAALLDPALRPGGRRNVAQKWQQMQAATALEARWSKANIAEAYLNLASFRGELQGIAAAALGLFDKHPSGLDEAESLLLSALLRAPNADHASVAQRACDLARALAVRPPCVELQALASRQLASAYRIRPVADAAGHFARRWSNRNSATRSSIDADLQALVNNTLRRHLSELGGRNVEDGAVLVLDNRSGEILAYAGSSGDLSAAAAVDGVRAKRQAGSTLKPFLYALALEQRLYTAASIVTDTPLSVPTGAGLYVPQNYERDFKGAVSLRSALGASLNVPAVRVAQSVGVERFYDLLKRLGFDGLTEGADHYGPAIALGSAEVSLWELTNAYRALANGGWWSPPRDTPGSALGGRRSLSRQASFVVADILADRSARALTFGLESALGLPFWAAVKTGTSKDMRDNWAIGFSDRYCIGVWVGNFSGAPMWDVSGVTGAAPIWAELMRALHDARPSRAPKAPTGLVQRPVFFSDAIEPPRREWFLAGTELNNVSAATGQTQILYPSEGSILALDPDIPAANQWVIFSAAGAPTGALWELDGATVAEPRWAPQAGAHQLRLLTSAGRQLAAVNFLVRGTSTDPDFAPLAESP